MDQSYQPGSVALDDLGFERGLTAFITFRCRLYNGKVVALHFDDQYKRLVESCKVMGMNTLSFSQSYLLEKICKNICSYSIKHNQYDDYMVKLFVTAGQSPDHMTLVSGGGCLSVAIYPFPKLPTKPFRIKVVEGAYEFPSAKIVGKYTVPAILRNRAQQEGFDDILLADEKHGVTETSVGNIFFVGYQGCVHTPERALHGVTRSIVLGLAKKLGHRIKESPSISLGMLYAYKEAFLTSTTKGVFPISTIVVPGLDRPHVFNVGSNTVTSQFSIEYNQYVEDYFLVRGA